MKMSDEYINDQLSSAQKLLWGGSETENIEAHNIISKLIKDRVEQVSNQGQAFQFTVLFTNSWIVDIIKQTRSRKDHT